MEDHKPETLFEFFWGMPLSFRLLVLAATVGIVSSFFTLGPGSEMFK